MVRVYRNKVVVDNRTFYMSRCIICGAMIPREKFHPRKYCSNCRARIYELKKKGIPAYKARLMLMAKLTVEES